MMKRILLVAIVVVIAAVVAVNFAAPAPPVVGSVAPEFTLQSQEDAPVSLKSYRGQWVVLYFYPRDFTSGCTVEAHNFQRDQAQYQQKDVVVLGVSVDSADSHKQFCTKEGLNFKLLADTVYGRDRKSTRLNSSHQIISYAVFCLKKKNQKGSDYAHI